VSQTRRTTTADTGAVPIVIGVKTRGTLGDVASYDLRSSFEAEFRSHRQLYPNSPFLVLVCTVADVAQSICAAAAACDIECRTTADALKLSTQLARCCHVLIVIVAAELQLGAQHTLPLTSEEALVDSTLVSDELGNFEQDCGPEIIQIALGEVSSIAVTRQQVRGANGDARTHPAMREIAMRRTDQFNRDAAALRGMPSESSPGTSIWPSKWASQRRNRSMCALYAAADTLALAFQRNFRIAIQLIFWLAATAAVLYGTFTVFASNNVSLQRLLLTPYLLLLVVAYAVYYLARKSDIHDKFIEYRALAEGLRVQCYWDACGIVDFAADCYSVRYPADLNWIRLAIRSTALTRSFPADAGTLQQEPADEVLRFWIKDQESYYLQARSHALRIEKTAGTAVRVIFGLGGLATLAVLFQSQLSQLAPLLRHISFFSFLCPWIAAGLVALVNKLGILYESEHYSRMLAVYARARHRLESASVDSAMALAASLGRAALTESGEWTLFRRERRIDEPVSPFRKPW
jgi:hypothetical protein